MSSFSTSGNGYGAVTKASVWPVIVAIVFILASALLYVLRFQLANDLYFIAGYLLTPVGVTMAMAWDLKAQRAGQVNSNFDVRPQYTRVLRVLAVLSFLVGIAHILELGRLLGEFFVQSGLN